MASGFADQDFLRYVTFLRLGPDCFYHTEVVRQSIDKNPSFCLLERRDLQLEAGVEFTDYAVNALPEKPACAGDNQAIENCPK